MTLARRIAGLLAKLFPRREECCLLYFEDQPLTAEEARVALLGEMLRQAARQETQWRN